MTKAKIYDRDGNFLPDATIVPDGGRMVTHMTFMDSAMPPITDTARHSPGGVQATDADLDAKAAALDARDKRIGDAWKNPPSLGMTPTEAKAPVTDAPAAQPTADQIEAMHDRRHQRLESAYKGA